MTQEAGTIGIPVEIFVLLVVALLVVLAIAGGLALIFGPYVLIGWLGRKLHQKTAQRDSRGGAISLTPSAKFGIGNLPGDVTLLSGLGRNATPQHSLNEIIMRPTIGLRLVSVLIAIAFWFLIAVDDGDLLGDGWGMTVGLVSLWAYSFVKTNFYELRYDTHGFITRDWFFRQCDIAWKDVAAIQDNGHYLYVVKMKDGQKLEIQKYLVGIRDFLTYVQDQIAHHSR